MRRLKQQWKSSGDLSGGLQTRPTLAARGILLREIGPRVTRADRFRLAAMAGRAIMFGRGLGLPCSKERDTVHIMGQKPTPFMLKVLRPSARLRFADNIPWQDIHRGKFGVLRMSVHRDRLRYFD